LSAALGDEAEHRHSERLPGRIDRSLAFGPARFIVFIELGAAEPFAESVRRNRHDRESRGVEGDEHTVVELMAPA
jgi:hypothetical protein